MRDPILLCYNLEGKRAQDIRQLAEGLGIEVKDIPKSAYHQPLAALAELVPEQDAPYEGPGFEEELIIMGFFLKGMLSQLLDGIRAAGMAPVQLKAVLTPTNARWHSMQLHKELMEEYEYFRRREEEMARRQGETEA